MKIWKLCGHHLIAAHVATSFQSWLQTQVKNRQVTLVASWRGQINPKINGADMAWLKWVSHLWEVNQRPDTRAWLPDSKEA